MQGQQVFGMGMEYASGEPFYASGHQILYNLCRPHGEFVERLPSMRRGRHSLGDVQHTCQLSSWWRKELLWQSALESHDDKGVWAALLLPTSASDGWKNLSHFLHTCNLSAYPLLRAVCNILESISTTEPRVTVASAKAQAAAAARCRSYDKDEEDTPGFWTGQTVEDSSIESRNGYALWCVDAVAMAKVVQRVVDDLILGSGQELTDASSCSSTKWMTLVQKNGRIDLKKEDTVHWMWAMQHAMRVQSSSLPGWDAVGNGMVVALAGLLVPSDVQLETFIITSAKADFDARYKRATTAFEKSPKVRAVLESIPSSHLQLDRTCLELEVLKRAFHDGKWKKKFEVARADAGIWSLLKKLPWRPSRKMLCAIVGHNATMLCCCGKTTFNRRSTWPRGDVNNSVRRHPLSSSRTRIVDITDL